jgi:glycosyltransferase involved in cell wall biosynthesis
VRLLYYADGRSPIARGWIEHFVQTGHEVHWVSSFPAAAIPGLSSFQIVPVAFSASASNPAAPSARWRARGLQLRLAVRQWLGPLTVDHAASSLRSLVDALRPDLVHALRIPFEGMVAARASSGFPLLVSVWGTDFTLHAQASPGMSLLTRRTLHSAAGLHADCRRDLGLASRWGFPEARPSIVLPGNGGVRPSVFFPAGGGDEALSERMRAFLESLPNWARLVVNPRGFRAYVRNDTFFRAVPRVLHRLPNVVFVCPSMAGDAQAERWRRQVDPGSSVRLLPALDPGEMAALFRRAEVSVSPSTHDGTPNTLLEAMACGCFPIAGDLESVREWLVRGETGLIVDPADDEGLAWAIVRALEDDGLRQSAARRNVEIIRQRADYATSMEQAEAFYREVVRAGPVL